MPEQKSAFDTPWFNSQRNDFFNSLNKPKTYNVVLAAETDDFDEDVIKRWKDERFRVAYVPLGQGGKEFVGRVQEVGDAFGPSEYYGVVAFGDAASLILAAHTKPSHPKLCAIVAYYPSTVPAPRTKFPASIQVLVHLAGAEVNVSKTPEVLGIQAKTKTVRKRVTLGSGYGGRLDAMGYQTYVYEAVEPGFAERDLDEYDARAEEVAFTRSLACLQKGFRIDATVGIESVRDGFVDVAHHAAGAAPADANAAAAIAAKVDDYAHILHAPTLAGGVGADAIARFYTGFFAPRPADFTARLLSRTMGADRVVDELDVRFTHSCVMHWILPSVPPTGKKVEVVVVSVSRVAGSAPDTDGAGGKKATLGTLESEHVYWDQASVLVQVGLLDAKLAVPEKWREKGVQRLPVVGVEAARAVRRGSSRQVNGLIEGW